MPHIQRDGVRIFYETAGESSGAVPLLLTHGYSATTAMWRAQLKALSAARQVIAWDIRGHGQSDSPDAPALYSEEESVADMAAILDELGVERAAVGGLSLGGYLSLAFYRAHPERVAALLLLDTGPGYRNPEARAGWNDMANKSAHNLEKHGLEALGAGRASAEVRIALHRSAQGLAHAARGILAQKDSRVMDLLPSVAVPTMVLVGANDERFVSPSEYMAKKIPNATHVVLPDAGHAANLDQPEAFNEAVRSFLAPIE